jgi:diguanylate cyclase (GGDEF)-like protein
MRQFIRHPVDVPVEIGTSGSHAASALHTHDISLGGLAVASSFAVRAGTDVEVRIPYVQPPFTAHARVAWCCAHAEHRFELGVAFLDVEDAFRARMVEQVCHIEDYRQTVRRFERRELSSEEAAVEWIAKHAAQFPDIGANDVREATLKKVRSEKQELERLGRALRTLSGSNRALLRVDDEPSLLREICRVVIEEAGYRFALVGRAEDDTDRSVTILARLASGEDLFDLPPVTWADTDRGRGATGTAIRTAQVCVVKDTQAESFPALWREFALQRGYHSLLSLPLHVGGRVFGALTIGAPEADAFDDEELQVLKETADDLAFGLETLRTRHRRAQAEAEILRLNRALRTRAAINRALARASDEAALLQEVCRVAVEECGYRLAWVGYLEHDETRTNRPVAYVGFEDGYLALPRNFTATERGRWVAALLEANVPAVTRDVLNDPDFPFREEARERGYGSVVVLPLRVEGELAGSVHILAAEADAFDEREVELLMAAAADLGYGLGGVRARERAAAAEATIKRMAYFDAVTGLPNRVRMREMLSDAIAASRNEGRPLALLRVEIERFREINETVGDAEVDKLMQHAAARVTGAVGDAGQVARVSESEFAVILPRGGSEQALRLAQRVLTTLCEPVELSGLLLDARSNIGISLFPGHGNEAEALMRRASIALDQARTSGSSVSLFKGGLDRDCAQRLSLMGELRGAIERDELLLYCQPKLQISSGQVCGAEALVQWQHPRLGVVSPSGFIKLAESTGLITPLTYWMLDAALRQSYLWHQHGSMQPLSVNLSVQDLRDPKLVDRIAGSLDTWGAQPDWIEFELTESALMVDPVGALEILNRLKRLDVRLAIDDYGTGYSSLSYLQRLPVDALKIDQSFIADMQRNKDSATIVRSTIELAHNLDLSVIAEGVEDEGTFDRLATLGCDMAQGYCISRPMPADQFQTWEPAPARRH